MYADILNAILGQLPDYEISIGTLPVNNGIAMYIGSGAQDTIHLDKGSENSLSLVMNAKNSNQLTCLSTLSEIHRHLTKLLDYPATEDFQILNIRTSSVPNFIGQEANKQYFYGSILEVTFYVRGVELQ